MPGFRKWRLPFYAITDYSPHNSSIRFSVSCFQKDKLSHLLECWLLIMIEHLMLIERWFSGLTMPKRFEHFYWPKQP